MSIKIFALVLLRKSHIKIHFSMYILIKDVIKGYVTTMYIGFVSPYFSIFLKFIFSRSLTQNNCRYTQEKIFQTEVYEKHCQKKKKITFILRKKKSIRLINPVK